MSAPSSRRSKARASGVLASSSPFATASMTRRSSFAASREMSSSTSRVLGIDQPSAPMRGAMFTVIALHPAVARDALSLLSLVPRLVRLSLVEIAGTLGVSTSSASKFRPGLRVLASRHWAVLTDLVSSQTPESG